MSEEMLEIWDWITGKPTGKSVERTKAHREGIPHEGVHLWIIRKSEDGWQLLFQRRASTKETFGGYLDITVGGHVPFGTKKKKIQKEAQEEIGINPTDADLIDLGIYRYEEKWEWMNHREFQHVYLMEKNDPLESYTFNDGEVEGIAAVPLRDITTLFKGKVSVRVEYFDGTDTGTQSISKSDLHPLFFTEPMKEYLDTLFSAIGSYILNGSVTETMS
jgi:isopentenyldiphosphate isomerase